MAPAQFISEVHVALSNIHRFSASIVLAVALVFVVEGCAPVPKTYSIFDGEGDFGIVNGKIADASADFSRSIVAVENEPTGMRCTGFLIAADLVVTAAHCVVSAASNLVVHFTRDISKPSLSFQRGLKYELPDAYYERRNEPDAIRRPDYQDIALIKLSAPAPSGYRPAQVLSDWGALKPGATVRVAGFGNTDWLGNGSGPLRYADIKLLQAKFGTTEVLVEHQPDRGPHVEDSGGPAFVQNGGQWKVFGVCSRYFTPDHSDLTTSRAVYTTLNGQQKWLTEAAIRLRAK